MDENRKQKILDHTDGQGVDVAIVATSSLKALDDAIDMATKRWHCHDVWCSIKRCKINLDMNKIYSKEITLVTSYAASDSDTKEALRSN